MNTNRQTGKGMNRRAFLRNAGTLTAASCRLRVASSRVARSRSWRNVRVSPNTAADTAATLTARGVEGVCSR